MDLEPVDDVHRPNHGLANALRKAALVPEMVAAFKASKCKGYGGTFNLSQQMIQTMQVAMLFEVCGRESDIGFNDDPTVFLRYHTNSCKAFEAYAKDKELQELSTCLAALERMYMSPRPASSAACKRIFEACHDLDLFRCYGKERMDGKLSALKKEIGEVAGDRLARLAVEMIVKTGDRLMYSPFAELPTGSYSPSVFPKVSKGAQACIDALTGVVPSLKIKVALRPGPAVVGEGAEPTHCRFIGSRFKLLYEAQKLQWDQTKWDSQSNVDQQLDDVREAVRQLVSTYNEATGKGLTSAQVRSYADKVLNGMPETGNEKTAVWLWTSAKTTAQLSVEFCSILNEALRVDVGTDPAAGNPEHASLGAEPISPMLQPAVLLTCMLQRFLNATRRIENGSALEHEAWPKGDGVTSDALNTTYRGGGLPSKHFGFFQALAGQKQWYRVPHLLATSFLKRKAYSVGIDRQDGRKDPYDQASPMPKVLWIVQLDSSGCLQGNYLEGVTQAKDEKEFLFSAYSAFQVVSAKSAYEDELDTTGIEYEITIKACRDNKHVSDDVPTAPWH
mmetsp:Transcript_35533/g.93315  ORF Transcript_35533/g.93315 Transcript_35533/m.93315 type:complete len:561 (+) Transcript_35533:2-1684(+)